MLDKMMNLFVNMLEVLSDISAGGIYKYGFRSWERGGSCTYGQDGQREDYKKNRGLLTENYRNPIFGSKGKRGKQRGEMPEEKVQEETVAQIMRRKMLQDQG